jgi:hypothetical protein
MTDDDRVAYLAGEQSDALTADERAELDALRDLLADPALWAEPDIRLEERVVDGILAAARPAELRRPADGAAPADRVAPANRAAGGRHAHPSDTAAAADFPAAPPVDELAVRRKSRTRTWLVAAAAAVVAAVAGLGIGIAVGHRSSGGGHTSRLQFAAALAPTPLAPRAKGSATLTKFGGGWRISINATGLPRRDNGAYYEAWLKNAAGVLVPIGTFNQPSHVVLWAGVPPTDFPLLTITRQTVGGGEDSSGQVVLSGPTHQLP